MGLKERGRVFDGIDRMEGTEGGVVRYCPSGDTIPRVIRPIPLEFRVMSPGFHRRDARAT